MGKQKAITMQDRRILAERWANGENATVIAVDLGFSAAAIYAELKRGSDGTLDANKRNHKSHRICCPQGRNQRLNIICLIKQCDDSSHK